MEDGQCAAWCAACLHPTHLNRKRFATPGAGRHPFAHAVTRKRAGACAVSDRLRMLRNTRFRVHRLCSVCIAKAMVGSEKQMTQRSSPLDAHGGGDSSAVSTPCCCSAGDGARTAVPCPFCSSRSISVANSTGLVGRANVLSSCPSCSE